MTGTEKFKLGQRYGEWEVIGPSERNGYVKCRCDGCGKIYDVQKSALVGNRSRSCKECARHPVSDNKHSFAAQRNLEAKKAYIGKVVNGFLITDIFFNEERPSDNRTWCKCICPKCGKEFQTILTYLKRKDDTKRITCCKECMKKLNRSRIPTVRSGKNVDGSDLSQARASYNGRVYKTSTTGVNGVAQTRSGRYVAHICFQQKTYYLGTYSTLEEAAAARKEADNIIFLPYLQKNEGWEKRICEELAKLKERQKKQKVVPKNELKEPVYRKCSKCGKLYWTKNKHSYMCEDCAKAVKSSSVLRTRVCARCGAEFEGYPRSKYCPQCKPEVEREQAKERRKRKPRKIGSEDICEVCGKPYIVKSGLQKYCPECAKTVVPENIREHKREYMAEHSETYNAIRDEKRHGRLICKVCGKPFEGGVSGAQTCSPECAAILRKQAMQRAEKKRSPRKHKKKEQK